MNNHPRRSQKGVSLIELMIAITLSIFIAAALIALFINSKQSYRVNENMSRLQENARFAVTFLSRDLRMADYHACVPAGRNATAVTGTNDAGLNNSDTITLLWEIDDCSDVQTTIYSIQAGSGGGPALFRSVDGVNRELVEGIEDLQILYGEDTSGDDVANYYVEAASVTDMVQVISVRFTLVARTLEANLTSAGGRVTREFNSTITLRNRLP